MRQKEWVVVKTEYSMFVHSFKYSNSIKHVHEHTKKEVVRMKAS